MSKINCLIVDDEQLARTLLENFVAKVPVLEVAGLCKNPLEALGILQQQPVELIYLDIQMPELTGTEFLKTLPQTPKVIFTTAYPDYALEGYTLNAIDYLLKPFSFERFIQATNKAIGLVQLERAASLNSNAVPQANTVNKQSNPYITLKADHKMHKVWLKDILYIEGMKEYVAFHLPNQRIIVLESLKNLEASLPNGQFMRIHKSFIVNTLKIEMLEGNLVYLAGKQLPIGKSYREVVLKSIFGKE